MSGKDRERLYRYAKGVGGGEENRARPQRPLRAWKAKDHDFERGGERGEDRCAKCGFGPDNPVHT